MTYDVTVPDQLKSIQEWFGSIIARPLEDNKMCTVSPAGNLMETEACTYIAPSPTLQPAQRIELYNQQYWWRLLKTMHEAYPFLLRLFGPGSFNTSISVPFLQKYPPNHWSLSYLGERLPQWIEEEYKAEDKKLVLHVAQIDCAFISSFLSAQIPLAESNAEALWETKLRFQPHVRVFTLSRDLFALREAFLKEKPEHWLEHDFPAMPPLTEPTNYILFQQYTDHQVAVEKMDAFEYTLFSRFEQGTTVSAICDWLETLAEDDPLSEKATSHLHLWLQRWLGFQWLCLYT